MEGCEVIFELVFVTDLDILNHVHLHSEVGNSLVLAVYPMSQLMGKERKEKL